MGGSVAQRQADRLRVAARTEQVQVCQPSTGDAVHRDAAQDAGRVGGVAQQRDAGGQHEVFLVVARGDLHDVTVGSGCERLADGGVVRGDGDGDVPLPSLDGRRGGVGSRCVGGRGAARAGQQGGGAGEESGRTKRVRHAGPR